ncbi:MAG: glycoside hydrolase family 15 protein [Deltaproteobacteria bacterium]|nr:MAG: glycoside hydrolase family 15 protein [Deltaproteobacteria bacterium]
MSGLDLAMIGNCTWGGLLDARGRLVWACLPRFDSDPLFPALLDGDGREDGVYAIELAGEVGAEQHYDGNSPILVTRLRDAAGGAIEIRDFAPRFSNHTRFYRPTMMIRRVRPLSGEPRIRIVLRPRCDYGAGRPAITRGSNHLRYVTPGITLRLTTDAPISYVADATQFVLQRPLALILGPDEPLAASIESTARDLDERTQDHWVEWVRSLSIPFEWQDAVIRAAIALKLCAFEETGAIVAALTTSIPEAPGSGRNWDYRFCWLRDAYFVIQALNRLGATRTMEGFLSYISNLAAGVGEAGLQPLYGIGLEMALDEREAAALGGFRGMGPVRVGNQAFSQIQNDIYGGVVLAATQSFFDRRLLHPGGDSLFRMLETIGEYALRLWNRPDAGLWEFRSRNHVHTFSAVMCWAACDRLARIAAHLGRAQRAQHWSAHAQAIRTSVLERAWSEKRGCFAGAFGGDQLDASLLLLPELGFLPAADPRFGATLAAIERELRHGDYLYRYSDDEFGAAQTAFNVCTFWYIDALAAVGRREEARALFANMLARRNPAGLLSEDLDGKTGELWGNLPQTYSMVGLINSAMRLSKRWEEAL